MREVHHQWVLCRPAALHGGERVRFAPDGPEIVIGRVKEENGKHLFCHYARVYPAPYEIEWHEFPDQDFVEVELALLGEHYPDYD